MSTRSVYPAKKRRSSGARPTVCNLLDAVCGDSIDASPRGWVLLGGDGFAVATRRSTTRFRMLGKRRYVLALLAQSTRRVLLQSRFVGGHLKDAARLFSVVPERLATSCRAATGDANTSLCS
jgi:hypothetical protein